MFRDFITTVKKPPILIIGIIMGVLLYLGSSIVLSFLVLATIYYFINSRPANEKKALIKLVLLALILRLIFFGITISITYASHRPEPIESPFFSQMIGHSEQVFKDFGREIRNGKQLARYLRGEFGDVHPKTISYHGVGHLHAGAWTQGILNFVFGESIFNLLIFPLMDLWSVIIVYYLAKTLFDERVAIFSSCIYAIMPSIIVISCSNIRFSMGIFFFLLIILSLAKFSEHNNFKYLILLIISAFFLWLFKDKAARPVLLILPFTLFLSLNIKFRIKLIILLVVSALGFMFLWNKLPLLIDKIRMTLQDIIFSQKAFVSIAEGSTYKIYDEFVYLKDIKSFSLLELVRLLSKGLVRGLAYFMFVPFPWETHNTLRLYAYPYILFWYFIIPFALFGAIRSLFLKIKGGLPIILLCSFFTLLLSLVLGNEGIAARYRELLSPIYYIFACSLLTRLLFASKGKRYNTKDA